MFNLVFPCPSVVDGSSGAAAKDEWDFQFQGMSNHPFVKANYPHHEGIWGWGNVADQVILMVRNIREIMVECEYIRS